MGYVLYGAGYVGCEAARRIGVENIEYYLDSTKSGLTKDGIPIISFNQYEKEKRNDCIVITVSDLYKDEIAGFLKSRGYQFMFWEDLCAEILKARFCGRTDYIAIYQRAIDWIKIHSIPEEGIVVSSEERVCYPEVTGYYIPTLLRWGYRDLAMTYAKWLLSIQNQDGSWSDAYGKAPYIFDSAQILKGLLALRGIMPEVDEAITRGCDWILSCMNEEGRLITPDQNAWGTDTSVCDEKIHIYCLSPIIDAGKELGKPEYIEKVNRIWDYYKTKYYDEIMEFSLLSHFYAYLMEALVDLGEIDMAREAMNKLEGYMDVNGAVPALHDVDWVCSTGLFQLAMVWFRLGKIEVGNRCFEYGCKLQNESGGWFGSYLSPVNSSEENFYFPSGEISWANKFFLDALYYKNCSEFDTEHGIFLEKIDKVDGRYALVFNMARAVGTPARILDVGCGKGRYIKNLLEDLPDNEYHAVDLSLKVMASIDNPRIRCVQGSLTEIPYPDDMFDATYTCEALEHAVDVESAIREMTRVTKPNGKVIIVDKNKGELGRMEIGPWEQWFDGEELKGILGNYCSEVELYTEVDYEGKKSDGLFYVWVGTVK